MTRRRPAVGVEGLRITSRLDFASLGGEDAFGFVELDAIGNVSPNR